MTDSVQVAVQKKAVIPYNENSIQGVDDLIKLDELNEPVILENLKRRYEADKIYVRAQLLRVVLVCSTFCFRLLLDQWSYL